MPFLFCLLAADLEAAGCWNAASPHHYLPANPAATAPAPIAAAAPSAAITAAKTQPSPATPAPAAPAAANATATGASEFSAKVEQGSKRKGEIRYVCLPALSVRD